MPELPEVETIAADLRPHLVGRSIVDAELRFPSMVRHPEPEAFVRGLRGAKINAVRRRGKFIHIDLGDALLVVHLGMSGQLRLVNPATEFATHTHVVITLDDRRQLRYRDPRRFGRLVLGTEEELVAARALPALGPEPLAADFSAEELYARLHKRKAPIKAVLLDQGAVAGVGNIYADESLFRARIRPDRMTSTISRTAMARLHRALQESLQLGIANRGASVDTYRDAWGEIGGQQERLLVYGRAGEPCFNCGRRLASSRIAGRTTVFCRRCQR